jgi:MOSC domain-containing protein YiiM
LKKKEIEILAGQMGENLVTAGIDLLNLPVDTILSIGNVMLKLTGLRKPCYKLNAIHPNLLESVIEKKSDGTVRYKSGVMAVVINGGVIRQGDGIFITKPLTKHKELMPL